jgi:hypothetical protein
VTDAARRETDLLADDIRQRLIGVARDLVIEPAELELSERCRYRAELEVAAGHEAPA